jgi:Dolichyl-phosphate-mannose-protein mannosyltransferase
VKAWTIKGWSELGLLTKARENAFEWATGAVVMFGFWLRINGWLGHKISFWYDESMWAMRLLHRPLEDLSIRPLGFMWLTRFFVNTFGATEVWFRLLPAIGALGSLLLFPYVVSQLVASKWLRLLGVLLFAIHPALVDYANEFKPYSWEVLIHLAPIALYLRFRETDDVRWFYALLAFLPVGFLLAYNLAFAYPGMLLLCLLCAWRSLDKKKLVALTLASGLACAATGAVVYKLALSNVTQEEKTESYWGGKYRVFYQRNDEQSRLDWTVETVSDMAAFVGIRRVLWHQHGHMKARVASELGSADRLFWIVMVGAGLLGLLKARRDLLWVLLGPLLVTVLGNYVGKWPLGAFRTNLFIIVYVLPLALLGFQFLATTERRAQVLAGLVLSLSLIPGFAYGFDLQGHKRIFTRDHYQRQIIAKLKAYRERQLASEPNQKPLPLLLEPHTYSPHSYYLRDHPTFKPKYEKFFEANFKTEKVNPGALVSGLKKRLRREKRGMWIVSSSRRDLDRVEAAAERYATIVIRERIADEHVLMFLKPKAK